MTGQTQMQPIDLNNLTTGTSVLGLVLIKEYTKKPPNSKAPLKGTLHFQGRDLEFAVWENNARVFDEFQNGNLKQRIFNVTADVNEYQGKQSLVLGTVDFNTQLTCYDLFYKVLDTTSLRDEFSKYVNELDPNFKAVIQKMFEKENVYNLFTKTWAGAKMHDAYIGGLLHHTVKLLRIAQMLMYNDKRLVQYRNLIYTSISLHDIGKIYEIALDGTYTKHSYVTHRSMGVEMLAENKQFIVEQIGADDYYQILAVIQGHHGVYGEKPTTVLAYIIHLIDMLEATTTGILDRIENKDYKEKNGNKVVWVGSDYPNLVVD